MQHEYSVLWHQQTEKEISRPNVLKHQNTNVGNDFAKLLKHSPNFSNPMSQKPKFLIFLVIFVLYQQFPLHETIQHNYCNQHFPWMNKTPEINLNVALNKCQTIHSNTGQVKLTGTSWKTLSPPISKVRKSCIQVPKRYLTSEIYARHSHRYLWPQVAKLEPLRSMRVRGQRQETLFRFLHMTVGSEWSEDWWRQLVLHQINGEGRTSVTAG